LFIFGLHRLRYEIPIALGHGWLQFGEFSVKRHSTNNEWHPEFQRAGFSSNVHDKLGTVILAL
jgi:hypothetical protein